MKEFYLENGQKVQLGDFIRKSVTGKFNKPYEVTLEQIIQVTKESLPYLLQEGILVTECKEQSACSNILNIEYYIQKIAQRCGLDTMKLNNLLTTISKVYPVITFSLLLKEIAIELDKKYEKHISESPYIYVISTLNGKITQIDKRDIRNYKNFAAFRTFKDAQIALLILKDYVNKMFNE